MKAVLLLAATLSFANTHNFPKVWVNDTMSLNNIKMVCTDNKTELFYNGKKMDSRYSIVSCKKPKGYCLVDKGN